MIFSSTLVHQHSVLSISLFLVNTEYYFPTSGFSSTLVDKPSCHVLLDEKVNFRLSKVSKGLSAGDKLGSEDDHFTNKKIFKSSFLNQ